MNQEGISAPSEVAQYLGELGVTAEAIRQSVEAGERARRACTRHHPITAPGYNAWSEGIKTLRDELTPLGFVSADHGGVPMAVHEEKGIGITVTGGNEGTGHPSKEMHSRYPKGPRTVAMVEKNVQQLEFDSTVLRVVPAVIESENPRPLMLWCLVVHRTESESRYELSLPAGIGADGHVTTWRKRIFFEPIVFDDVPRAISAEAKDIIVEVTRKS